MILQSMLQRLLASLMRGPGLNARPHNSRQRIDVMDFRHFGGTPPDQLLTTLLERGSIDLQGTIPLFKKPEYPESEWSDEQKDSRQASERQNKLLGKLRDIAQDATDYYNDHGDQALFIGFPLLSVPVGTDRFSGKANRILAPVLLAPVNLRVRRTTRPGVTIELAAEGADRVMANPALLAWIEQQTGVSSDELFTDEGGAEAWKEIADALAHVAKAAGAEIIPFASGTPLVAVPKSEDLPDGPALLSSAVLGLLPLSNPGLLRDTRWMSEHELELKLPLAAFLKPAAIAPAEDRTLPEQVTYDLASATSTVPDYAGEWLVTQADPCQAGAVAHARSSETLVIHGPPGTGKSQTIANIIGDHLARGEKVLFVCDKRTALDVVKYRLDSMGLGALCGVVHDPQHDRKDLYLNLRERLQELPQEPETADPRRELEQTNQRLAELHLELRKNFDQLHTTDSESGRSFHELVGEWYEAHSVAPFTLGIVEGLNLAAVVSHRTDADEVLRRSLTAAWPSNPFREKTAIALEDFLVKTRPEHDQSLETFAILARLADEALEEKTPELLENIALEQQAAALDRLADALEAFSVYGSPPWTARIAGSPQPQEWTASLKELDAHADALKTPLDRELVLQSQGAALTLPVLGRHLLALTTWQEKAKSWTKIFAFGPKKEAGASLAPLGLSLNDAAVERALNYYAAVKSRWLWTDLLDRVAGSTSDQPAGDDLLKQLHGGLPKLLVLLEGIRQPASAAVGPAALAWLSSGEGDTGELAKAMQLGVARATGLAALETNLRESGFFRSEALVEWSSAWRAGVAATPVCESFIAAGNTLEEVVRREDRMRTLPGPVQGALEIAALAGQNWAAAEPGIKAAALALEIRDRLRQSPELARLDTNRIEAAFSELLERSQQKQQLVRRHILRHWQQRWRTRLLAATGSRLNSDGAALRQRLFVRGQRAMKLRQMINAGAEHEGGDPLFDLCPVWMASPATVAQIFPREALFDVIVFDEASQCRLEEALPVLLRGRRTVIAGDPKQLPPTRFFEQALAESDDTSAETADEVFEQQQSEAEDLLSAALNLDVQEAFLDVHYRSRNEALIGFSNQAFYSSRLQPIPGHPRNKALNTPIRIIRASGVYVDRTNPEEAKLAADLVAELLDDPQPPSIGIACFNITQRDTILDALEERASKDPVFAERLEVAKKRRGRDSFEGLFVKNLENVQGDERDHLIISTTFGPDPEGKFRRNFGALSRSGGERRLNVLVTRARDAIHVITSVPRSEYLVAETLDEGRKPNGRHYLYDYLRYAEQLSVLFERYQNELENARRDAEPVSLTGETATPSRIVAALGRTLLAEHKTGSTVYWGNDGFSVDIALTDPELPEDVTVGLLVDFTRYRKSPDPIVWEQFRSSVLRATGWQLHRLWTPAIFRDAVKCLADLCSAHDAQVRVALEKRIEASRKAL